MKILITGATGFIGQHLIKKLLEKNNNIHVVVRKTTKKENLPKDLKLYTFDDDIKNLIDYMNTEKFDGVIHLASLFLASHKEEDIYDLINSNVLFSTLILEASVKSKTPWFINTGTFTQHYKNKKYSPTNLYSATKQALEDIAKYYTETNDINFVTIKLFDTFGPNDTRPKIFSLWSRISKSGEKLDMSPGEQIIDINYVENVVDGYIKMIEHLSSKNSKKFKGKVFSLSSGERMTLKQLAKLFEKITNKKLNINWGKRPYREREVMVPWEKSVNVPGWKPKIKLKDAVKKTIEND